MSTLENSINFHSLIDFQLPLEQKHQIWINTIIISEGYELGPVSFIFCDDNYLYDMNVKYLSHDTLTDIITFDYTENKLLSGDIFISVDRVLSNASIYGVSFDNELKRVMAHGILHLCGYKDKTREESDLMRIKEEEKISLFHVEQSK